MEKIFPTTAYKFVQSVKCLLCSGARLRLNVIYDVKKPTINIAYLPLTGAFASPNHHKPEWHGYRMRQRGA